MSQHNLGISGESFDLPVSKQSDHLESRDGQVQATKHDGGKRRNLFPVRALNATNDVFTYGANKYSAGNWHQGAGFDWDRLDDAFERHMQAWRLGEDVDPESGHPHLAHAMCCLAMLLEHTLTGHGNDTRKRNQFITHSNTHETKEGK